MMHPDWKAKTTIKELVDGLMGNVGPRPPEGLRHDVEDAIQRAIEISKQKSAPNVHDDWLRAIDEALVVAHIGVANPDDTYEQAKAKLDNFIGFHVDVATDPAVNGGWKLVPMPATQENGDAS